MMRSILHESVKKQISIFHSEKGSRMQNQSESFRPWIHSDWFWLEIRFGSIRARIDVDWKLGFGLVWIHVSELIGLIRIDFWSSFIKRVTKRFSDWFGMIRIGSDIDIQMNRNSSDWLGMNFNPIISPGDFTDLTDFMDLNKIR